MSAPSVDPTPRGVFSRKVLGIAFATFVVSAVIGWAVFTNRNRPAAPEMVEVWVAAKDLPIGTHLVKEDLPKLIVKQRLPRERLPASFVAYEEELLDKWLARPVRRGETFDPSALSKGNTSHLLEEFEYFAVPIWRHEGRTVQNRNRNTRGPLRNGSEGERTR